MIKRNTYFFIIGICVILCILFYFLFQNYQKNNSQDDILFFKFLGENQLEPKDSDYYIFQNTKNSYYFNVDYRNTDFKTIGLGETIDNDTLIQEKVAPGTKGSFDINIYSNETCEYEIIFKSDNEKPKNLVFFIDKEEQFETLEKLQESLKGIIEQETTKNITVFWQWKYENGEEQDAIDTNDGKLLTNYYFDIAVCAQMKGGN